MITIQTGTSQSLDAIELIITIKCVGRLDFGGAQIMPAKEQEERRWADIFIDKIREQKTGGGWGLWNYENIKVTFVKELEG